VLQAQCETRAPLFDPRTEQAALLAVLAEASRACCHPFD
jgi:hypothetical protein